MSNDLYTEAIADARKLRQMAEENAKNKIVDVVSSRIRNIIDKQILGEAHDMDMETLTKDAAPEEPGDAHVVDLDKLSDAEPSGDDSGGVSIEVDPAGEISVETGGLEIGISASGDGDDDLILNQEVAEALARIVGTSGKSPKRLSRSMTLLENKVKKFGSVFESIKETGSNASKIRAARIFEALLREAVTLKRQIILIEQDRQKVVLDKRANTLIKEMNEMSRRSGREIFDFLFEGEEPEAAEVDVTAAEAALEDLGDALGLDVEVEQAEEGGDEADDADAGDEEEELDLGEMDEMMEAQHDEMDEDDHNEMDEVYEIDESVLRRALSSMRQRRLHEQEGGDPVDTDPYANDPDGEVVGDTEVEVDEDDLLNALADELGTVDSVESDGGAGDVAVAESRRRRRTNMNESRRNRALKGKLVEYQKAVTALKGQLVEMNLFNAKLLYANKLMQNRNLTPKQQRAIVEALDNAKTLREAKLLYKSLTSSLVKKGNLSEGRSLRTLGSASKSARSAQPITEGAGSVDRWAVLAGINKD